MATPRPPPRLTGNDSDDIVAITVWANQFYEDTVVSGTAAATIDPEDLPDPNNTNLATAQQTANEAYTAALAAVATVPIYGSDTLGAADTNFVVVFDEEQKDTSYFVIANVSQITGTPAVGARRVSSIAKTVTGFTLTVTAAPGAGDSVTYDWIVGRNGD